MMNIGLSRRKYSNKKKLKLANYLLIVDTDATEKNYFDGIKQSLPYEMQHKVDIQILQSKKNNLLKFAIEQRNISPQYVEVWIILDRDKVSGFDNLISTAKKNNIKVAWTNPCIEEWFLSYFGKIYSLSESTICCKKFAEEFKKITGQKYIKSDKKIYEKLIKYGDEQRAIKLFNDKCMEYKRNQINKPSEMIPGGTIHKLVDEITKYK